jgi:hypothetical protein
VKIGQAVQKIWQGEGTAWRLEEKDRGSARKERLAIRDQVNFADIFD